MPIIQYNPPDIPALASRLPAPLQKPAGIAGSLIAQLTGANDPAGMVMNSVAPAPIEALSPMTKELIDRAKASTPAAMDELQMMRGKPDGFLTAHPAVQELWYSLTGALPKRNPVHEFSLERISTKPSAPSTVQLPEGFGLSKRPVLTRPQTWKEAQAAQKAMGGPLKRDPIIDALSKQYQSWLSRMRNPAAWAKR